MWNCAYNRQKLQQTNKTYAENKSYCCCRYDNIIIVHVYCVLQSFYYCSDFNHECATHMQSMQWQ